jgi:uncharacterized membrane protein SirB2
VTEYYSALRSVHIGCALVSIALFAVRGGLMLLDSATLRSTLLNTLPHVVDTVLLATAVMLAIASRQYPLATGWLTVKVLLLVVYVALGSVALKRGRTRRIRAGAFVAALLTVGFLVTVARARSPLGFLAAALS